LGMGTPPLSPRRPALWMAFKAFLEGFERPTEGLIDCLSPYRSAAKIPINRDALRKGLSH